MQERKKYDHIKKRSIASRERLTQPKNPKTRPWAYRIRSRASTTKAEEINSVTHRAGHPSLPCALSLGGSPIGRKGLRPALRRSISPEISSITGLRSGIAAFIGASFSHGGNGIRRVRHSARARYPQPQITSWRETGGRGSCYFFGYPTDCAKMILCCGCNFRVLARAGLSTLARTTAPSPSDAQYR